MENIERNFTEITLDQGWQKSLAWHWDKIQENKGITIFTPEKQQMRTFGVLIEAPEHIKSEISSWLDKNLPLEYNQYIIRQPSDGYRISLEWTEQENIPAEKKEEVLRDIQNELQKFSVIEADIALAYPSFVNIFAPCLMNNQTLEDMRNSMRTVFDKHNLRVGIPPEVYGAWISLVRFKQQLPPELIDGLQRLPKEIIPNTKLKNVLLTVNDPMFTKEASTIIEEVKLHNTGDLEQIGV
jgi:hypothetical protein